MDLDYKPCKSCKATDYDNVDDDAFSESESGVYVCEPNTCDKCNFELALSPSNEVH